MTGMHADLLFITGLVDVTVFFNEIVVPNAFVVKTGVMAGTEHIDSEALVAARCTAMNDNEVYSSHRQ